MYYHRLEKLINLYDGYRQVFKIDSHQFMLLQIDDERFLVESNCPHREYPLKSSDVDGMDLVCPQHGYRFDIRSGELRHYSEEFCRNLRCYELVERDSEVGVMLEH
jgi:nitrite reductase/ring-hydroxylating ferredoxin subunit